MVLGSNPGGGNIYSFLQNVHTVPGFHTASFTIGTLALSRGQGSRGAEVRMPRTLHLAPIIGKLHEIFMWFVIIYV